MRRSQDVCTATGASRENFFQRSDLISERPRRPAADVSNIRLWRLPNEEISRLVSATDPRPFAC